MKIDVAAVRKTLKSFDFKTLFYEHLGWDKHQAHLDIPVDGNTVSLTAIAQKRGFVAFVCRSMLDRPTRLKIDHQVTKSVREHFVIYADEPSGQQVWHWVRREAGKPLASRDHRFDVSQSGDPLIQRLEQIAVTIQEEETLTLPDVAGRISTALDVEKVTKEFYDQFKTEHAAFLKLIKGVAADADLQWYTSLMLNRLMFVYFIQKKGFLDGDTDYLRNRLAMVRKSQGKDRFQSFYRYFLLRLFHEGLGKATGDRKLDAALERLLGRVPYLNGGFFEVHQLEENNPDLDIPDRAFEKLFDFFDQYSWHLDERPRRAQNEINPDVVGYIFEKYINQKQMGAYYTKEDITEYIAKNTIIPYLFDAARKKCAIAFKPDSALWRLLRDDPDRYIYPAVGHGVTCDYDRVNHRDHKRRVTPLPLPAEIEAGVKDVSKRDGWNEPAPEAYALPTETWREVVARRQRCQAIRDKLSKGEVHEINDLVTLNLDTWQFARDAIVNAEGPELLRAFWHTIAGRLPEKSNDKIEHGISVLDPTCGSGAFLFAALRILETLYGDCLERMARFVEDDDAHGKGQKYADFRIVLSQIGKHPSERYFILKSIIINNLFGVDIMEEAVEICKLRLFLKLVAQVETVAQIEPLPDIDFNIRAGNTLVGYATLDEIRKGAASESKKNAEGKSQGLLLLQGDAIARIEEDAEMVDRAFQQFRAQQVKHGGKVTTKEKKDLIARLAKLDAELDRYLAGEYSVNVAKTKDFDAWKLSHQPFHWFVEFYGIMHAGGFDVVIGNPPYVNASKVRATYAIKNLDTGTCPDIYAPCVERGLSILRLAGRFGMILPISFQFSNDFSVARRICKNALTNIWVSTFSRNPSALFTAGLGVRNTICLGSAGRGSASTIRSTVLNRWVEDYRPALFQSLAYSELPACLERYGWPRLDSARIADLFANLVSRGWRLDSDCARGSHCIRFKTTALYYISAFVEDPPSYDQSGSSIEQTKVGGISFSEQQLRDAALVLALGKMSLLWWAATGDDFDVTASGLGSTPLSASSLSPELAKEYRSLTKTIQATMKKNVIYTKYAGKWMGNYDLKCVRHLTDAADRKLLDAFNLGDYWEDIELAYAHFMKMTGERPGTIREVPDFDCD